MAKHRFPSELPRRPAHWLPSDPNIRATNREGPGVVLTLEIGGQVIATHRARTELGATRALRHFRRIVEQQVRDANA